MGADMISAVLAHKKDVTPNFEAGREHLNKIAITEEVVTALTTDGRLYEEDPEYFNEDGSYRADAILEWMLDQFAEFEDALDGRDVNAFHIRDLVVYFTGGLSWGDEPEVAGIFWSVAAIPGLLEAMGFEQNFHEEEKAVTPEEEEQAIQSIQRSLT